MIPRDSSLKAVKMSSNSLNSFPGRLVNTLFMALVYSIAHINWVIRLRAPQKFQQEASSRF